MKLARSVRNEPRTAEPGRVDVNHGVSIRRDRDRRAGGDYQMGSAPPVGVARVADASMRLPARCGCAVPR